MGLLISYRMAAISHLSDAQEMLNMGNDEITRQVINRHINFAKKIIMKQITHDAMATQDELDNIWKSTKD